MGKQKQGISRQTSKQNERDKCTEIEHGSYK